MSAHPAVRVRVHAPPIEARRLVARLTRGGIVAAPDDGETPAEVLVVAGVAPDELAPYRARCQALCAVARPAGPYFAAGADEVIVPGEPEILFRRLRLLIERADLHARIERLTQRAGALEQGLADAAHDLRAPLHAAIGNAEQLARDPELPGRRKADADAVLRQAD